MKILSSASLLIVIIVAASAQAKPIAGMSDDEIIESVRLSRPDVYEIVRTDIVARAKTIAVMRAIGVCEGMSNTAVAEACVRRTMVDNGVKALVQPVTPGQRQPLPFGETLKSTVDRARSPAGVNTWLTDNCTGANPTRPGASADVKGICAEHGAEVIKATPQAPSKKLNETERLADVNRRGQIQGIASWMVEFNDEQAAKLSKFEHDQTQRAANFASKQRRELWLFRCYNSHMGGSPEGSAACEKQSKTIN